MNSLGDYISKIRTFFFRHRWLEWLTFTAIFIFCLKGLYGEDIWFHLATGRYVFEQRTIPVRDVFSFTGEGQPWVNQNWLADLTFFLIDKFFGDIGLAIFFSFLFFLIFVVLFRILKSLGVGEYLSLFLVFLSSFVAVARFQARPEPGSYLFFLLVLWCLFDLGSQPSDSRNLRRSIPGILHGILLPFIFLLWVNWQAGFVPLGLFVLGLFFLRELWISLRSRIVKLNRSWIGIILLSFLAIFLNPNGLAGVTYFFQVQPKYLLEDFTEWGSFIQLFKENRFFSLVFEDKLLIVGYLTLLIIFLSTLVLWFKSFEFNYKNLKTSDIFIFLLGAPFILLPFFANRFASLAVIFMAIMAGHFWGRMNEDVGDEVSQLTGQRAEVGTKILCLPARYVVFILCLLLLLWRIIVIPPTISAFQKANPWRDEALTFLKNNKILGNMFNPLEDGGYIIWVNPDRKVFMDGRLDVYTGSGIYEDYKKIYSFPPKEDWQEVTKKYQIEIIFLPGWQKEPMETIRKSDLYSLVYWSDYLFILLKKDGINKEYVEKNAPQIIEPLKSEDYPKESLAQVIAEYQQLKELSPGSANIATALASAYQDKGQKDLAIKEYERSVSLKPDDGMVRLTLGNLYFEQSRDDKNQCQKAQEHFEAAAKRGSMIKALAYRNLGFVYEDCFGDFALALFYFKNFLQEAKKSALGKEQGLIQEANQKVWELKIRVKRGY